MAENGFEEKIVRVNRVSKKTKGGNKISFSVLAVVGDKKGKVGVGLGKASDVSGAIRKAVTIAKKHVIEVPIINGTIPFEYNIKLGAAKVLLKPAPLGSGVIAGGAVRSVVRASGIQNISSKVLGTKNQASNVYATIEALKRLSERYRRHKKPVTTTSKVASAEIQKLGPSVDGSEKFSVSAVAASDAVVARKV